MCNVTKLREVTESLNDYLEYVNTDVDQLMAYEPELYAAYAAHTGEKISRIKDWYLEAEQAFITTLGLEDYIESRYDYVDQFNYWDKVQTEIDDGDIFECGGYWFRGE